MERGFQDIGRGRKMRKRQRKKNGHQSLLVIANGEIRLNGKWIADDNIIWPDYETGGCTIDLTEHFEYYEKWEAEQKAKVGK